jgi:transcriptional regulator with XRE-family HTH domain
MSTMPCNVEALPHPALESGSRRLPKRHRIKTVRHQQGVSLRRVARTLKIDVHEARLQEDESSDLSLSQLYAWSELLDVPVTDLLVESTDLSPPVLARARLVKLMKTAAAIRQESNNVAVRQLADMLIDQIAEIMPELRGVNPWPIASRRRRMREYGRALERIIPATLFRDH